MEDILKDASSLEGTFDSPAIPAKWYSSDMDGIGKAPVAVDVNWGVNALDAMLVTGFNKNTTSLFEYTESTKTLKVVFATNTNYVKHSIIAITGTGDAVLDTEHRVIDQGVNYFTIKLPKDPTPAALTKTGVEVKYASLGWEVAFSKGTRRVYRSKNANGTRPYVVVEGGRLINKAYASMIHFAMSTAMEDMYTATEDAFTCPYNTTRTFGMAEKDMNANKFDFFISSFSTQSYESYRINPNGTPKPWVFFGDDRLFTWVTYPMFYNNSYGYDCTPHTITVGDIEPEMSWDKGATGIGGGFLCSKAYIRDGNASSNEGYDDYHNHYAQSSWLFRSSGSNFNYLIDYEGYNRGREVGGLRGGSLNGGILYSGYATYSAPSVYGMKVFLTKPEYMMAVSPSAGVSVRGKFPSGIHWVMSKIPWITETEPVIVENLKGYEGTVFLSVPWMYRFRDAWWASNKDYLCRIMVDISKNTWR